MISEPGTPTLPEPGDDWDLLARAADGDEAAFGTLVRRHQDRLLRLCERLLGRRALAEEAVQEVFLKLHSKYLSGGSARLERRGQLFTLLYRMATNHCLNRLRRRRIARFVPFVVPSGEEGEAREIEPPDPRADSHAALEARRRWEATLRGLERLSAGQRAVVVLVRLEGLSYKEAARHLGISAGAVESRLFRAMRALERVLEEESGKETQE